MTRTVKLTLGETEYTMLFSARVMMEFEQRDPKGYVHYLITGGPVMKTLEALESLMAAGAKHERSRGAEAPKTPTAEELADIVTIDDMPAISRAILECVEKGAGRLIEARPTADSKKKEENSGQRDE